MGIPVSDSHRDCSQVRPKSLQGNVSTVCQNAPYDETECERLPVHQRRSL
jgi:hypothetical protein